MSGKVVGDMAYENIQFGDLNVPKLQIGIANEVIVPLMDEVKWDGIVGLALPTDKMKAEGILPVMD